MVYMKFNRETELEIENAKVDILSWALDSILEEKGIRGVANRSMDIHQMTYDTRYYKQERLDDKYVLITPRTDTGPYIELMSLGNVHHSDMIEGATITRYCEIMVKLLVKKGLLGIDRDDIGGTIIHTYDTRYFKARTKFTDVPFITFVAGTDLYNELIHSEEYIHEFGTPY